MVFPIPNFAALLFNFICLESEYFLFCFCSPIMIIQFYVFVRNLLSSVTHKILNYFIILFMSFFITIKIAIINSNFLPSFIIIF